MAINVSLAQELPEVHPMVHWNFEKSHTFIEPWDEDTLTAQTFFSLNPSASHLWNRLAPMTLR